MVDLISTLVVFAIILAFVAPWVRSLAGRNRPPVTGQPVPRGPREFGESGGFQPVGPARPAPSRPIPAEGRTLLDDASLTTRRPAAAPAAPVSRGNRDGKSVRRALATPGALRTAILLKEIMDPPISIKEHRR